MDPLVSFVVPCYNYAHFLTQCINSVLAQTCQDFEVLIMDNCSSDNTPEVAASFHDSRVKYIRNDVNIGHVRNFNKGVTLSRGKYVWLLCADDYLRSPNVLDRFLQVMEQNAAVGFVFCRSFEVRGANEVGLAWWTDSGDRDRIWKGSSFLRRLVRSDCIVMSSALVRKDCFIEAGSLCADLPHACDWYLWLLIALRHQVAYVAEPMVSSRTHEESVTASLNRQGSPVCTLDELNVLWRVALQAETLGVGFLRSACNASIACRAARALQPPKAGGRAGLSLQELEALVRANARNTRDEEDIWAHIYRVCGDEQYWDGEFAEAARSYGKTLGLRPWNMKLWAKFMLLSTGKFGSNMRRVYASFAAAAGLKEHPRRPSEEPAGAARAE